MSFPDSLSIDVGGGTTTLNRVSVGDRQSVFESIDGNIRLSIRYLNRRRTRREIRVSHRKTATDPLFPSQNRPYSESVYLVIDTELENVGFTPTEQKNAAVGLMTLLTASTNANLIKFTQGEI